MNNYLAVPTQMRASKTALLTLVSVLCVSSLTAYRTVADGKNSAFVAAQIPTSSLCDLQQDSSHTRKTVRVSAILVADKNRIVMWLLDNGCGQGPVWIEAWCNELDNPNRCTQLKSSLTQLLGPQTSHRPIAANVELVGEFVPAGEYGNGNRIFIQDLVLANLVKSKVPRPPPIKRRLC